MVATSMPSAARLIRRLKLNPDIARVAPTSFSVEPLRSPANRELGLEGARNSYGNDMRSSDRGRSESQKRGRQLHVNNHTPSSSKVCNGIVCAMRICSNPSMQHLFREALVGYVSDTDSDEERAKVEWHLANCPVCREEITARDIVLIVRDIRDQCIGRRNN